MKSFVLIFSFISFSLQGFGQTLFAVEYSDGEQNFIKIENNSIYKYPNIINGPYWGIGKNKSQVITSNRKALMSSTLGKSSIKAIDTIHTFGDEIWGLTVVYPLAFVVISSNEGTFYEKSSLYTLNLKSSKVEKIDLPDSLNFLNISLSPDKRFISFIHTAHIEDPEKTTYYYILYDRRNDKLTIFDTASYFEGEWFAGFDDGPMSSWINRNEILYYKRTEKDVNGSIFSYTIDSKKIKEEISIPLSSRRLKSFSAKENCLYFIDKVQGEKSKIFVFDKTKKKVLYEVPYEEDFLLNHIEIK